MLFLLFLNCLCFEDDPQGNLTEICINTLQGNCSGIFEVKSSSDFERYCIYSQNLTLYLINDFFTAVIFNMIYLNELKNCRIVGLSNSSYIYIASKPKKSRQINFKTENVVVDFSSHSGDLVFNSLTLHDSRINFYDSQISAKTIESDLYSLSNLEKIYALDFNIDFTNFPKTPITLSLNLYPNFDSNELKINIFGLVVDVSTYVDSSRIFLIFEKYHLTFTFNINSPKASFILQHSSPSNTITLYSSEESQETNNWACGLYQLGVYHTGQLSINLTSSNFYLGKLSVNQLNLISTVNCLCRISQFESTNVNQSVIVSVDENITIDLFNDIDANVAFIGKGQVNIVSDFNIDHFRKLYFQNLNFASSYSSIKVDVTRDKKEALIMAKENFNFLNNIVIYPIFNESKFSYPDDIDSLLGKTLLTFCAPNADIETFDVRAQQVSDINTIPPGFTTDAMSFSLQQNQNCISLIFAKDPESFLTKACIYNSNSSLCENITDLTFNASKGESPFDGEITTQYINLQIAEDLPKDYFLNFSKLTGKHEIHIKSLDSPKTKFGDSHSLPLIEINIADLRTDTTETSLIFDGINAHFNAKAINYERIYLINGSKIINNIDLSKLNSLEFDFNYSSVYDNVFYGCDNIQMHHVSVDEISYEQDHYTFIKNNKKIIFPNNHTYTLSFDSSANSPSQVRLNILTDEIKPLIFRSNTLGPFFINFTNLTVETPPTLTAVQLKVDSSSEIYFNSPTSNIPVEIISLKDSSTFEKMKRIIVYSDSSIDRGFYPTSFKIQEDNVSFIAFSPSSSKPIPSFFSEIDISSDTYIISENYDKGKHSFGNISFITNDIKIDSGVKATLIYGMILKSITTYENSQLNLFHVAVRNPVSINYHVTLGQKPSLISLYENQSTLDFPSKTPFFIKDDSGVFIPQTINIMNKIPHRNDLKNFSFLDSDNDTVEYCILMLKSTDRCDILLNVVTFDPNEIVTPEGIYTFKASCLQQCLAIEYEFHENDHKPTSKKLDTRNIIIIASLSGVLLILIIIIIVLVVKRRQNPNDYMKSLLMTLPSDM